MKIFFIISLFLATVTAAFAQRQNVYFLKNNGKYVTTRDSADYIRIVRQPDSTSTVFDVLEFYSNGVHKLAGKSTRVDPPEFEGQCVTYYSNGKRQSLASYKNGVKMGADMEFYPNGRLYTQFLYTENTDNNTPDNADAYRVITNNDSLGIVQVADGNGYYKGYNNTFTSIEEEGPVKNGKRDGQWKGNFHDIGIAFTETYQDGVLISGTAVAKNGKISTYTKSRRGAPQFKGGLEQFASFLSKNIIYPISARKAGIEGRVILSFAIEEDGSCRY